jgi:Ran GTPase-activating protein (RanGAP) involved in mRNA processing and transport
MAVFPFWRKFLALVTRRYKLTLKDNSITSMGLSVLLETMGQNSNHITDLDLRHNPIGNEGARLLARSLGNNALPNLTRGIKTPSKIFGEQRVTKPHTPFC